MYDDDRREEYSEARFLYATKKRYDKLEKEKENRRKEDEKDGQGETVNLISRKFHSSR